MRWYASMGMRTPILKNFKIGASVVAEQIVVEDAGNKFAEIGDPSANDYSEAIGCTTEAGTYSTTQGTGDSSAEVTVEVAMDPLGLWIGKVSGGTAPNTAWVDGTDGNLMVNTSASAGGTVLTDADVGTSDYITGLLIGLTGNNAGFSRVITAHSDNTSETVTVPFDYAIAVGDKFLRTFGVFNEGLELTTDWTQFNGRLGAGVNLPDTGHAKVWDVLLDGGAEQPESCHGTGYQKRGGSFLLPASTTNPGVWVVVMLIDAFGNAPS